MSEGGALHKFGCIKRKALDKAENFLPLQCEKLKLPGPDQGWLSSYLEIHGLPHLTPESTCSKLNNYQVLLAGLC